MRWRTAVKTARSTKNANLRRSKSASSTARQPVSSHSRPNSPQPAEQEGRPDPSGRQRPQPILGMLAGIEPGAHLDRRHEARHRRRQPLETASRQHRLLPAQLLDDPLPGASSFAHTLDEVQVGVAVDRLLAHEHHELARSMHHTRQPAPVRRVSALDSGFGEVGEDGDCRALSGRRGVGLGLGLQGSGRAGTSVGAWRQVGAMRGRRSSKRRMRGAAGQAVGRWMAIRVLSSTMMKGQEDFHPIPKRDAVSRPRRGAAILTSLRRSVSNWAWRQGSGPAGRRAGSTSASRRRRAGRA